jgi:hypothetical protein
VQTVDFGAEQNFGEAQQWVQLVLRLLVGEVEKAKILDESKDLLADLCSYRSYPCTTSETRTRTPVDC